MQAAPDIFVSYDHVDSAKAENVTSAFRRLGYSVWTDKDVRNGQRYRHEIIQSLQDAKSVVVIWTQNSVTNDWVLDECEIALSEDKLLMLRDDTLEVRSLPPGFGQLHCHAISEIFQLEASLRSLGATPGAAPPPPPPAVPVVESGPGAIRNVSEVFSLGRPTWTFVDRRGSPEYASVYTALTAAGRIVVLHGPSKCGKTTLANTLLNNPVVLHGTLIASQAKFFASVAKRLGVTDIEDLAGIAEECASVGRSVMIDDFHSVPKHVQKAILVRAKAFTDLGCTFVLLSLTADLACFAEVGPEVSGRLSRVRSPRWQRTEIEEIGRRGFEALGLDVDRKSLAWFATESYGNPLLMQEHCGNACSMRGIHEGQTGPVPFELTDAELNTLGTTAGKRNSAQFDPPAHRRGDPRVTLSMGREISIYNLVLLSISQLGVSQPIGMQTLHRRMKRHIDNADDIPRPEKLLPIVTELVDRYRRLPASRETIDLIQDLLYVLHPTFKLYLVWCVKPNLIPDTGP